MIFGCMFCCSLHSETHENMGIQGDMEERRIGSVFYHGIPVFQFQASAPNRHSSQLTLKNHHIFSLTKLITVRA